MSPLSFAISGLCWGIPQPKFCADPQRPDPRIEVQRVCSSGRGGPDLGVAANPTHFGPSLAEVLEELGTIKAFANSGPWPLAEVLEELARSSQLSSPGH